MDLQRMSFDADVARLIRRAGSGGSLWSSKTSVKAATPQLQGRLMLWGWITYGGQRTQAMLAALASMEVINDQAISMVLFFLSQPALGWLGCVLVTKAVSNRTLLAAGHSYSPDLRGPLGWGSGIWDSRLCPSTR